MHHHPTKAIEQKHAEATPRSNEEIVSSLPFHKEELLDELRKELKPGSARSPSVVRSDVTVDEAVAYLEQKGAQRLLGITSEAEKAQGELSRRGLRSELGASPTTDAALLDKTQKMVDTLARAAGYSGDPIQVEILESKETVGVMHPGGTITLTTGLIEKVGRDEALMGILAHEITHHSNRDSARTSAYSEAFIQMTKSSEFRALAPDDQIKVATTFRSALDSMNRDIETQADLGAVRILKAAGIDPEPFAEAIERVGSSIAHDGSYLSPAVRAALIRDEARK